MSSVPLRNHVYGLLSAAPALNAVGLGPTNLYANFSADSPDVRRFCVIRWGVSAPGVGRARPVIMTLWAYDRDPDYSWISAVLAAAEGVLTGAGPVQLSAIDWTMDATWQGGSDDLYDDGYQAYTRNASYRLVATGI